MPDNPAPLTPVPAALSPEILSWAPYSSGGRLFDPVDSLRPYQHWRHAEDLVRHGTTEFHRIDCVATLRRAVDSRLRRLNSLYEFKRIPVCSKPDGIIDICEKFGIFRPLMVQKLQRIRNRVEHQDVPPPGKAECAELVEFVWYFLKSTDSRVAMLPDGFHSDPDGGFGETPYGLTFRTGPKYEWTIEISGWVPSKLIATPAVENWIDIACTEFVRARDIPSKKPSAIGRLAKNKDDDTWVIAHFLGPDTYRDAIFELYFQAD